MPEIFVAHKKREEKKEEPKKSIVVSGGFLNQVKSALSAFVSLPKDVHFENQEAGEEIILLLRKHWVTNIPWLLFSFLMLISPTFIFPAISYFKIFSFMPIRFQAVALIFWYVVTFSFLLTSFINWYFNVYIVTDRRIIDVDFYSLLYKEISACYISKIQDVTYQVLGGLKVIFDYGNVLIQTAGTEKNLEFEQVPKPAVVVKKITELMEKIKPEGV